MSNNVNRTFLTHLNSMAHTAQARSQRGTWVNVPVTVEKSQKNMHRNDEFSHNFRHFSSYAPLRQKNAPSLGKILTTRLMPQLRITPFQVEKHR